MSRVDAVYAHLKAADPIPDVATLDSSAVVARVEAELGYTSATAPQPTEDIPTGRPTFEQVDPYRHRWVLRPAWAAVAAFAATFVGLGGSLVLGVAVRQPGLDAGSAWAPEAVGDVVAATSAWSLLIPAIAVAVAIGAALIVTNQQVRGRKEKAMATAIETTSAEQLETVERNNRWLVAAVVVLALALVALGAWVIYDMASEPDTAATADINALYDDYTAAILDGDTETFRELTTENYVFKSEGVERTQAQQASVFAAGGLQAERVGEVLVMGDGPIYFVAVAERLTYGGIEYVGVSAYRVIEFDGALRIAEHNWVGTL